MDIAGAKVLKERLGSNGTDECPVTPVEVPEDAPPVYQWVGVSKAEREIQPTDADDERQAPNTSLFRRLGLSFR